MKFKTFFFDIEIEWLFLLVIFISIFSNIFREFLALFYVCYLFVIFHELAHINAGILLNKNVEKVKFSVSGACAVFKRQSSSSKNKLNILVYLAGPLSNILLAYIFRDNKFIFEANLSLAIINFIPIKPLDGYNITNEILKNLKSSKNNEKICRFISNIFLIVFIIVSIIQLLYYKNPSIIVFSAYLIALNLSQKDTIDVDKIISKITS